MPELEFRLTGEQWKFVSTLFSGMSQVAMASIAIPYFLDQPSPPLALSGVAAAIISVGLGLAAARKA